jgi:hypothetical protein
MNMMLQQNSMEQEFGGGKSRHYKSSKSLEQSKCICCRGDTDTIFLQLIVLKPILTQYSGRKAKLAVFFVKFDANGENMG